MKSFAKAGTKSRKSASSQTAGWSRDIQSGNESAGGGAARSTSARRVPSLAAIPHFLPSSPWGRKASTATMMRKVPTTA